MLTKRQQLTIEQLVAKEIKTPQQIIEYCENKIMLPRFEKVTRKHMRRHSKLYYQQIIDHFK